MDEQHGSNNYNHNTGNNMRTNDNQKQNLEIITETIIDRIMITEQE